MTSSFNGLTPSKPRGDPQQQQEAPELEWTRQGSDDNLLEQWIKTYMNVFIYKDASEGSTSHPKDFSNYIFSSTPESFD